MQNTCTDLLVVPQPKPYTGKKRGAKPFEFTDKMLMEIEEMARQGLNEKEILLNIGLNSQTTWIQKKKENLKLVEALERGKAEGHKIIANGLWTNATVPTKLMPGGNVEAQKFILARRYGWREQESIPLGSTLERVTFERIRPGDTDPADLA